MVPDVLVTSGLEALPPRPPTPPRDKSLDAAKQSQLLDRPSLDPRRSLQTPPDYSPYSSDLSNPTSGRSRKKVGFSSKAEYCDAPSNSSHRLKQSTPASASSTTSLSRQLKSILKPSPPAAVNPLDPTAGTDQVARNANIVTMLESTIKQLAGADRSSKLDAYSVLVQALRTSNNLPDRIALQDKMSLFTQFIQRDVTLLHGETGELDSSLSNRASTLLITFLNFPAIASTISNEFAVFIVDHCIRSFENMAIPKDVVRHLMQVVASQDFPAKVMTADRVGRLVSALHRIEEHLKGKSIIMSRILIYRRLIKQSKNHMVTHSDWLLDLFTDMLSSMKEIRATAIALGLEASFSIAKEKQLSKRVMEILELTIDETKYIQYYAGKLRTMAKSKDKNESTVVPQIWSVIILLLRCPVNKWEYFGPWLEIIQMCFNSADLQTKVEANFAWNRLVYCMQLNDQSFAKIIATICQPYESQLKRKKLSEELRKIVVGSLCNLYYYAFKPNTGSDHIGTFWDACIPQMMTTMISPELNPKTPEKQPNARPDQSPQAMQILTALFNSTTPRIWREDRIADSPLVRFDELPAIDPKWLRRNAPKVFLVIEPILMKTYLDLADVGSPTAKLWRTLVSSVAFAASKEIKVSTDTAVFMAQTFTFLFRVWSGALGGSLSGDQNSKLFYEATGTFISTLVGSLGLLPFTEKQLSMGNQNTFLPVATPSHRTGRGQGVTRTPLHHLFSILSSLPPGANDDDDLANLLRTTLAPFLAPKSTKAKVELAHDLMQSLPMDTLAPYGPWLVISEILELSLADSQTSHSSTSSGGQPPVGHEYREIVKHLERGLRSTPNLPWTQWQTLLRSLVARASDNTGEAGCAIAVVEPLAKVVLDCFANNVEPKDTFSLFRAGIELLSSAKHPRDRQAVESARRRLWGTSMAGSRSASFDTYDYLYKVIDQLLISSYQHYHEFDTKDIVVPQLTEVAGFLARCNQLLVFKALVNLQTSIGLWIQDKEARYNSRQSANVNEAVKLLWTRICNIFVEADNLEHIQLETIEPLLCSAFESKHRHIVNTVTVMWNRAFDQAEDIQYPERLRAVLLSLRQYVDIVLPGLDISSNESTGPQPEFIDSQDDLDDSKSLAPAQAAKASPHSSRRSSSRRSKSNTPGSMKLSVSSQRHIQSTPTVSRPRLAKPSATPRLRHDDSQVQFAPIASSSPIRNMEESQVLTERQREVRERQQDNAVLFPEIRSSIEKQNENQQDLENASKNRIETEKAVTPKSHRSFENYVSSTPTPRRGQALLIDDNDHEMTDDIPSSPPDPRRYPLLPEMKKPQSSSSSVLDEWQFTSSPISGSPRLDRLLVSSERAELNHAEDRPESNATAAKAELSAPVAGDDEGNNADMEDESHDLPMHDASAARLTQGLTTPPGMRNPKTQGEPKSDNEVFVDALTSPAPQTSRTQRALARAAQSAPVDKTTRSQAKDNSFEASDVDERSLWRLVVELDSRKREPPSTPLLPQTVQQGDRTDISKVGDESPVLDCITVSTRSNSARKAKRSRGGVSSLAIIPSTPAEISPCQLSDRKSRKKRKRSAEASPGSGGKKRRHSQDNSTDAEAVPDSQLLEADNNASLEHSGIFGGELQTSFSQGSSHEDEGKVTAADVTSEANVSADNSMDECDAVNLQIVQEASQSTEKELTFVEPLAGPSDVVETTVAVEQRDTKAVGKLHQKPLGSSSPSEEARATSTTEKTSLERILESLRGGLAELRTSALSRDEVGQVEDMFMDIKRELYGAEFRGRK